jgi:hypothetical protein
MVTITVGLYHTDHEMVTGNIPTFHLMDHWTRFYSTDLLSYQWHDSRHTHKSSSISEGQTFHFWAWWYAIGTISTHRPKQADAYQSRYVKANDFLYTKRWRLSAHTKLMTICSPLLHIKPSQCTVFLVCPAYSCLYPCFLYYILISDHLYDHSPSHDLAYCLSIASHHSIPYFIPSNFACLPSHYLSIL